MSITTRRRQAAVAATAVTAAVSWAVVTQGAGVRLGVQFPQAHPSTVGLASTVGAATLAAVAGWLLLAVVESRFERPRRVWVLTAAAVTVASLALPLLFAVGAAAIVGLVAIHLAVAAVALAGLASTVAARRVPASASTGPDDGVPGASDPTRGETVTREGGFASARGVLSGRSTLAAAGVFAAVALVGVSATGVLGRPPTPRATVASAPFAPFAASAPFAAPASFADGGSPWLAPAWRDGADTEYFQVASTRAAGPGAIVITGALSAGGVEQPGRSIDRATFAGGSFRINHSVGHPTVRFDRSSCVGTLSEVGPFEVFDATGPFTALEGHRGTYRFHAVFTDAKGPTGCTDTTTAYIETIDGVLGLGRGVNGR